MITTLFSVVKGAGVGGVPSKMTAGSTGYDIRSAKEVELKPKVPTLIGTGIALQIPDGFDLQLRLRSSIAMKGIVILNGVGTIDSDYQGEIKVAVMNLTDETITINLGERIAQLVLARYYAMDFFKATLEDNRGGFGSTGR